METLERVREVKEVYGYRALDGKFFNEKEQCEKYEESAKMVAMDLARKHLKAKTTILELFGEGSEEDDVEIYHIDNLDSVKVINQYIILCCDYKDTTDKSALIDESNIGQDIILCWGYDHDWCWRYNIDEYIKTLREKYERILKEGVGRLN